MKGPVNKTVKLNQAVFDTGMQDRLWEACAKATGIDL